MTIACGCVRTAKLILSFWMIAASAPAQTGWDRVQALAEGQAIRVNTAENRHEGAFVSASQSSLSFASKDGRQISVTQSEVTRVEAKSKSHRARNTAIGAAIGVGIGVAMYATFGLMLRNEGGENTEVVIPVTAAIGSGIGAILPTGGYKKIYDAGKPGK